MRVTYNINEPNRFAIKEGPNEYGHLWLEHGNWQWQLADMPTSGGWAQTYELARDEALLRLALHECWLKVETARSAT